MSYERIVDSARQIQTIAEGFHCASAIFAVEKLLLERLQRELNCKIVELSKELDQALEGKNYECAHELREEIKKLKADMSKRVSTTMIRVTYAVFSDSKHESARYVNDNGVIVVVLPKALQEKITNGVRIDPVSWTDEMKEAKDILRRRTAHELGHVVAEVALGRKAMEAEAIYFEKELIKLRNGRNQSVYGNGIK